MEWFTQVNWADAVSIIIILRSTYVGSQRGIFGELFYIVAIWIALVCGLHLYFNLALFLNKYLFIPLNIGNLLSFSMITGGIYLISKIIYNPLPRYQIIKIEVGPVISRIVGPALGFCKGFAISVFFFIIMLLTPLEYIYSSARTKSFLGPFFIDVGTTVYEKTLSIASIKSKNLTSLLEGAKPINLDRFKMKKKDRLDEILQ